MLKFIKILLTDKTMDRLIFGHEQMMVLVNIVNKEEGGRFWSALRERNISKNIEKCKMWVSICRYFCQVRFMLCSCVLWRKIIC